MNRAGSILVVDDHPTLLENVALALEAAGYSVLTAEDGQGALGILEDEPVSLILADIAMPGMNGYQLYERVRMRPEWVSIPFIFLTARAMDSDVRYGKELGADDYLTKPIEPEDLLSAVQGRLRRAQQLSQATLVGTSAGPRAHGSLTVGRIKIDLDLHQVWLVERPIRLSAREFALLAHLARHADRVVSPEELIKATHNLDTDRTEAGSLLRPLIRSLRRHLGYPPGEIGCIENVRGVGYRLSITDW